MGMASWNYPPTPIFVASCFRVIVAMSHHASGNTRSRAAVIVSGGAHKGLRRVAAMATNMAVVRTRREPPCQFKGRAAARRTPPR
jgi:hypothetical protein